MITMPPIMAAQAERAHQDQSWIWLLELTASLGTPSAPPVLFRLTSWREELQWPHSDGLGTTWYPFPFLVGEIEQNSKGDLPQLEVTVDNAARFLAPLLHSQEGFEGNPARVYLLNEASILEDSPNHEAYPDQGGLQMVVASAVMNDQAVVFRLEEPNYFHVQSPQDVFQNRCRRQFGGPGCGYIVNAASGFTTCRKILSDCIARGQDEAARLIQVLHPERFGAFPGIPTQRRL